MDRCRVCIGIPLAMLGRMWLEEGQGRAGLPRFEGCADPHEGFPETLPPLHMPIAASYLKKKKSHMCGTLCHVCRALYTFEVFHLSPMERAQVFTSEKTWAPRLLPPFVHKVNLGRSLTIFGFPFFCPFFCMKMLNCGFSNWIPWISGALWWHLERRTAS